MKYVTIKRVATEGAYGFTSSLELQQGSDNRCRILSRGFAWHGNEGGVRGSREGPFDLAKSAQLLARVRAAEDALDEGETLTYAELEAALDLP